MNRPRESPMSHGRLLHPLMQARSDASSMWPMLVLSVVVHLLAALVFSGWLLPQPKREDRPVYYVDLISKPVAKPQAGRPDGGGGQEKIAAKQQPSVGQETAAPPAPVKPPEAVTLPAKPEPQPEAKAVAAAAAKAQAEAEAAARVKAQAEAAAKAKAAAQAEAAAKAKAEAAAQAKAEAAAKAKAEAAAKAKAEAAAKAKAEAEAKAAAKNYQQVLNRVSALRKQKEGEEALAGLQQKIAAMARGRGEGAVKGAGGSGVAAPLGMPDGQGNEAGVSAVLWLQTYFRANWSLSKYQVSRPDLEAVIRVSYDPDGNLMEEKIVKSSGDKIFDQSVEDAVLKSRKLPQPLPEPFEGDVIFNLRDLQR